jgi:hypothetical protein
MPRRAFSEQELREIRDLAAGWGKIVARSALGEAGAGPEMDLDAMEQLAGTAARGLLEGTLNTLLEQQALTLGQEQPCPRCGKLAPLRRQPRPLHIRGGQLIYSEPFAHCPDCRRDFFPPAAPAAS